MPQKRYRPEEIIAKLRQADVLPGEGRKVPDVIKPADMKMPTAAAADYGRENVRVNGR